MHAILLLSFLLPGSLPASVHKCIGADGVASYQSLPCATGQQTAWTRRSERPAAPPPARPPSAAAAPARPPAAASVARRVKPAGHAAAHRCADARRAADLTRDRLWNRLSFRQRSDLDSKVEQACAKR